MPDSIPENLSTVYLALWLTYGLVPVVAGLDKFFNLLTDWGKYVSPRLADLLPVPVPTFMTVVGCIEIVAGIVVLTNLTRLGAHIVMAWLVLIAATLVVGGYLDIAVRDLVMAVGAYTLGQVAALRHEPWLPFARTPHPAEVHAHAR